MLDEKNAPIPESQLLAFLGQMDRRAFGRLFSMNHVQLRRGGQELLKEEGKAGTGLLSAATGSLSLKQLLNECEKTDADLYKPQGSKPKINTLIKEYKACKTLIRSVSIPSRTFLELEKELEQAQAKKEALEEEIQERKREEERLKRLQKALPRLAERTSLLEEIEALGDVKVLPLDFSDEKSELRNTLHHLKTQRQELESQIEKLKGELELITIPEILLSHRSSVNDIFQDLGEYRKTMKDLPKKKGEKQQKETEAQSVLKDIRSEEHTSELQSH